MCVCFSPPQIPVNTTNAQPLGQQLVAFTSRAAHFTDVMDVIFVTHLVERLTRLVEKHRNVRVRVGGCSKTEEWHCCFSTKREEPDEEVRAPAKEEHRRYMRHGHVGRGPAVGITSR